MDTAARQELVDLAWSHCGTAFIFTGNMVIVGYLGSHELPPPADTALHYIPYSKQPLSSAVARHA